MKKILIGILMVLVLVGVCFGCYYVYDNYIDVDNYKPGARMSSRMPS